MVFVLVGVALCFLVLDFFILHSDSKCFASQWLLRRTFAEGVILSLFGCTSFSTVLHRSVCQHSLFFFFEGFIVLSRWRTFVKPVCVLVAVLFTVPCGCMTCTRWCSRRSVRDVSTIVRSQGLCAKPLRGGWCALPSTEYTDVLKSGNKWILGELQSFRGWWRWLLRIATGHRTDELHLLQFLACLRHFFSAASTLQQWEN